MQNYAVPKRDARYLAMYDLTTDQQCTVLARRFSSRYSHPFDEPSSLVTEQCEVRPLGLPGGGGGGGGRPSPLIAPAPAHAHTAPTPCMCMCPPGSRPPRCPHGHGMLTPVASRTSLPASGD